MANNKKNIHKVQIKIEGEDWKKACDEVFLEKQKAVKVDGFRKGKVPRNIYEKKFGKESLYLDAANNLVHMAFLKAIDESKLEPIVQPSVSIDNIDEDKVEFTFNIITKPEIKIKKYKGLKVTPKKVEVTEDEINHQLHHLLERYTEMAIKENGIVEDGDIAIIDYEGFKDGVAFEGGKGENYSLEIGSHTFIPGFEEQLIGMKVNEEKDLNLRFPKNYHADDLKDKEVVFHVKVNEIKEKKMRELDKEFFEDLGIEGIDSEKKLREEIKKNIKSQKEIEVENEYVDTLLEEVSKNVEVDIPEELVEEEVNRLFNRYEANLKQQGLSLDLYYKFTSTTEKDLKNQLEKEAYKNVLYRFMLEELRVLEHQEVSEEEVEKEVLKLAKEYKMEKEEFLKEFGGLDLIKYDLEMRKVIDLLKEYNK